MSSWEWRGRPICLLLDHGPHCSLHAFTCVVFPLFVVCSLRGYNGTVRVLGIDVGVAADILDIDLDEELLLFLQARDVSLSKCRMCISCGCGCGE